MEKVARSGREQLLRCRWQSDGMVCVHPIGEGATLKLYRERQRREFVNI
jgi:hypothetical protein